MSFCIRRRGYRVCVIKGSYEAIRQSYHAAPAPMLEYVQMIEADNSDAVRKIYQF